MTSTAIVFVRPFSRPHGEAVARGLPNTRSFFISDTRGVGDKPDLMAHFYDFYDSPAATNLSELPPEIPVRDVILRCRWLRTLAYEQAERMVWAMCLALQTIIDSVHPDFVIGAAIDNYVLDLLERLQRMFGIPGVYPTEHSFPGLTRISSRGEHNRVRVPTSEEIESVLGRVLEPTFKPAWATRAQRLPSLISLRFKQEAKRIAFPMIKRYRRDPLNYSRKLFARHLYNAYSADPLADLKYFSKDWRERLSGRRPVLFFPLQFAPEVTLDYFINDLELCNYFRTVDRVLWILHGRYDVLLKEHPAIHGLRDPTLYKMIRQHPHATLVPTDVPIQEVVATSDHVLGYAGATTALEARLRGSPVTCVAESYFSVDGEVNSVGSYAGLTRLPNALADASRSEPDRDRLMRHVLETTIRTPWPNWGVYDDADREQRQLVESSGQMLYDFMRRPPFLAATAEVQGPLGG